MFVKLFDAFETETVPAWEWDGLLVIVVVGFEAYATFEDGIHVVLIQKKLQSLDLFVDLFKNLIIKQ